MSYEWSASGLELLKKIQNCIDESGGRTETMYHITNESPEWFTYRERLDISEKLSNKRNKDRRKVATDLNYVWKKEHISYLLSNYRITPTPEIARHLGRSVDAVRNKFNHFKRHTLKV